MRSTISSSTTRTFVEDPDESDDIGDLTFHGRSRMAPSRDDLDAALLTIMSAVARPQTVLPAPAIFAGRQAGDRTFANPKYEGALSEGR
jgi:hypothetical protein